MDNVVVTVVVVEMAKKKRDPRSEVHKMVGVPAGGPVSSSLSFGKSWEMIFVCSQARRSFAIYEILCEGTAAFHRYFIVTKRSIRTKHSGQLRGEFGAERVSIMRTCCMGPGGDVFCLGLLV